MACVGSSEARAPSLLVIYLTKRAPQLAHAVAIVGLRENVRHVGVERDELHARQFRLEMLDRIVGVVDLCQLGLRRVVPRAWRWATGGESPEVFQRPIVCAGTRQ